MEDHEFSRLADMIATRLDRAHTRDYPPGEAMTVGKVEDIVRRVVSGEIEKAIQKTVADTLISFGLDPQQRSEIQRDFLFIRDMRTVAADSRKHIFLAILTLAVSGIGTAIWFYVKSSGKM